MSFHEFLDVLGLPVAEEPDSSPEARSARLQQEIIRLTSTLQRCHSALVRWRIKIERLRQRLGCHLAQVDPRAVERAKLRIERHEVNYQRLLARTIRVKRKVTALRKTTHLL